MTPERDTSRALPEAASGLSTWRLALVVPGILVLERACSDWLPAAGAAIREAAPAWVSLALAGGIVLGLGAWIRAVSREEAAS